MTLDEIALAILRDLLATAGPRVWESPEIVSQLTATARQMAAEIYLGDFEIMATKILVQEMDGTPKQICFADHAADFSPAAANDLRKTTDGSQETDCQLDLTSLANGNGTTTGARQSDKVDLGENRARRYRCRAAFELAATPTAGYVIEVWWAPSPSSTAANANPGGVSGADGAYTGYSSNNVASMQQLEHVGDFKCTSQATGTVQVAEVGEFEPSERYGSLVIYNQSGAAFHNDAVESHVVFDPIVDEIQNA